MSRTVTVAAIQTSYGLDMRANIEKTAKYVREAAKRGAQIILPSELFQNIYFCTSQDPSWFAEAFPVSEHPCVISMQKLAKELGVVIPVSIFEKAGPHYYNSVAIVDHTGAIMGVYRKTHIPDGPGYSEKYYFRPGDLGFKVWDTKFGKIGVGICWDQWYPEVARAMVLQGAEILFYPTAIGFEPSTPDLDTSRPWQRAMQGHAVSNYIPVVAANRIGLEKNPADGGQQGYYGSSFIADPSGTLVQEANRDQDAVLVHTFDLDAIAAERPMWGFFRDRRTDLYGSLVIPT
ncbi:MAG: N-carbamoylputrescine amidase [Alphaproteobacteria bacterium]